MNIKEAKQEIGNTLRAYLRKGEDGRYLYPLVRQRPILLMGPPGIGKTAIMEQAAAENGVGLVAYTITHHTRQSAIGLPRIETRTYGGEAVSVTEYTLSEIVASIYDCMERTGRREGILFIDEINCVSETLAPTMLQFLQNKTFGSHRIPEGWMIVAAGNPPEYNKSVREFDIVTLDRVREIDVEADCSVWMEYAWDREVHGAILSYLSIKPDSFYLVENGPEGKRFVTARGWEDLSELLKSYEALQVPVSRAQVIQFLQKEEVAREFAAYYQLYRKYGADYGVDRVLSGQLTEADYRSKTAMAAGGSFEERFTVVNLVLDALNESFARYALADERVSRLHQALQICKGTLAAGEADGLADFIRRRRRAVEIKSQAQLLPREETGLEMWVLERLEAYDLQLRRSHIRTGDGAMDRIRELFGEDVAARAGLVEQTSARLERAFRFVEDCFGEGQEMVLLVSGLTRNRRATAFIGEHGCESYLRRSGALLYQKREQELRRACLELEQGFSSGE